MELEPKSKIETNPLTGRKSLIVYYENDDFDKAIKSAMANHGVKECEMTVIAIPIEDLELSQTF